MYAVSRLLVCTVYIILKVPFRSGLTSDIHEVTRTISHCHKALESRDPICSKTPNISPCDLQINELDSNPYIRVMIV